MHKLSRIYLPAALFAAAISPSHAQISTAQQSAIQGVFGVSGVQKPGGVLSFDLTKLGATATIAGQPVSPDLAFHGEINFYAVASQTTGTTGSTTGGTTATTTGSTGTTTGTTGTTTTGTTGSTTGSTIGTTTGGATTAVPFNAVLVTMETPLLEAQVNPFVNAALSAGLNIGAIHNHFLFENPRIIFVHVEGAGDAVTLAQAVKTALAPTGLQVETPSTATTAISGLDPNVLASTLGGTAEVGNNVVHVEVPRSETPTLFGVPAPPTMGAVSAFDFQPLGGGSTLVTFEIAMQASEAPLIERMLQSYGVTFTALHNHHVAMLPPIFFIHGSATGNATTIANQLRQVLNQTNSRGAPRVAFGSGQ